MKSRFGTSSWRGSVPRFHLPQASPDALSPHRLVSLPGGLASSGFAALLLRSDGPHRVPADRLGAVARAGELRVAPPVPRADLHALCTSQLPGDAVADQRRDDVLDPRGGGSIRV